ncbi:MAG: hypothetical protein F7C35_04725 [Desulfurococcales archaeon]|nr:hypothetical protein [Desulfurococcales archaeon]
MENVVMGKLAWALLLLLLVAAAGYYLDQKGIIDVNIEGSISAGKQRSMTWNNEDFHQVASAPEDHMGENVTLKLYIFNKFTANSSNGTVDVYDAYLGNATDLENDPYNTTKRVVLYPVSGDLPLGQCVNIEGYIAGKASVVTGSGQTINPLLIKVISHTQADCTFEP